MLIDTEFQAAVNFVYDQASPIHGQRKKAVRKGVHEIMQTDLARGAVQGVHILDFTLK